jgi:hypothetical protein
LFLRDKIRQPLLKRGNQTIGQTKQYISIVFNLQKEEIINSTLNPQNRWEMIDNRSSFNLTVCPFIINDCAIDRFASVY